MHFCTYEMKAKFLSVLKQCNFIVQTFMETKNKWHFHACFVSEE